MTDPHDRRLDALLAQWTPPPPSPFLSERIVATARPGAATRPAARPAWWIGAAGLGLAGALSGAVAVAMVAPPAPVPLDQTATGTIFGDLGGIGEG